MPMSIRDPRVPKLARELAARRGTTMTAAIVNALEHELARDPGLPPVDRSKSMEQRLTELSDYALSIAKHPPKPFTKEDYDALWEK